jgi:hypothetical protein
MYGSVLMLPLSLLRKELHPQMSELEWMSALQVEQAFQFLLEEVPRDKLPPWAESLTLDQWQMLSLLLSLLLLEKQNNPVH